ncbi:methyltransferase domain-containing protein [Trinickia sp. NRRL B-1857]|uniref:class I SAM-dependent methyltransferase n=1 Tax=Trinickia sp. NRRL B-1857 TaxID=3162879 RepID=UPI003D2B7B43
MSSANAKQYDIDGWLHTVAERIEREAPELRDVFELYSGEARFGRRFIATDLDRLPRGSRVLEVGAGSCLLSCQLVREGFDVVALEPVGIGFSHFRRMQSLVAQLASEMGCMPKVLQQQAETLDARDDFDFAFSVNVMEHVRDVAGVIARVGMGLRRGASYRFTCPNYAFPYEPHFDMPTLFGKRLTERLMNRRIFGNQKLDDPVGTWQSLNWITVGQIVRAVGRHPELRVAFSRDLLTSTLERVTRDPEFAARRSAVVRNGIALLVRSGLHRLPAALPASMLPIIDCRIERPAN